MMLTNRCRCYAARNVPQDPTATKIWQLRCHLSYSSYRTSSTDNALSGLKGIAVVRTDTGLHPVLTDSALSGLKGPPGFVLCTEMGRYKAPKARDILTMGAAHRGSTRNCVQKPEGARYLNEGCSPSGKHKKLCPEAPKGRYILTMGAAHRGKAGTGQEALKGRNE